MKLYFSLLKLKARLFEGRRLSRADVYRRLALRRRDALSATRMVGITGSGAKSSTSALVFHMLSGSHPSALSIQENTESTIAKRLARFPKRARYGVFEISGHAPGAIQASCDLVQPDIAIVTVVASDHRSNFRDVQATAEEKGTLPAIVARRGGLVLLNADDPLVLAMGAQVPAQQLRTFGEAGHADYRALAVSHAAPGRLQFLCRFADEEAWFDFGLLGRHLLVPALASIACAHQEGVPLTQLAARARSFVQLPGRCSLHASANGPTFICDTLKAPAATLELSFSQLGLLDAPRKTIVIGQISDYSGSQGSRYRQAYRLARRYADRVIFLGHVELSLKPLEGEEFGVQLLHVADIGALRQAIAQSFVPGEAILLKGSYKIDHLERIALDYEQPVDCWVNRCQRQNTCFSCDQLGAGGQGSHGSIEGEALILDPRHFCAAFTQRVRR